MVQFHEPLDQGGGVHRFHQHRGLVSTPVTHGRAREALFHVPALFCAGVL